MAKIPKGLSDKDMLQGYVEEVTMESQFMAAEAAEDQKRRAKALAATQSKNISLAGLDDALVEQLGRKLLELKMELMRNGISKYTMKVKREKNSIIITPVELQDKPEAERSFTAKKKRK